MGEWVRHDSYLLSALLDYYFATQNHGNPRQELQTGHAPTLYKRHDSLPHDMFIDLWELT